MRLVNYDQLLTDPFADNPFWTDLTDSMNEFFDGVVHYAADELYFMRSDKNDPLFVAYNTRMLGFQVPLNSFNTDQYINLLQSLGIFFQTKGASVQFLNFLAFIEGTYFNFIPLWADSLSIPINQLADTPGTLLVDGGTWFPTPYYDLEYNPLQYPSLNVEANLQEFLQLLYQLSPIYLVPRSVSFLTNVSTNLYVTPITYSTEYTRTIASYP